MIPCAPTPFVISSWTEARTSVVAGSESSETLLARSVPDLQLNDVVVELDSLQFEVDANGVEEVLVERVLMVPHEQARLAHAAVADQQHLEEVVTAQGTR